jgi:hypothetical protein
LSRREDEHRAQKNEPRSAPLCPRCGRPEIYPSKKRRGWWECANEDCPYYRRTFPSPCYGARGKPPWWDNILKIFRR